MSDKVTQTGGIGFMGLLAVLFIGLKLTSFIDWSWWWVLAPLWLPIIVILLFAGIFLAIAGLITVGR